MSNDRCEVWSIQPLIWAKAGAEVAWSKAKCTRVTHIERIECISGHLAEYEYLILTPESTGSSFMWSKNIEGGCAGFARSTSAKTDVNRASRRLNNTQTLHPSHVLEA